jgi:hypothetical protein
MNTDQRCEDSRSRRSDTFEHGDGEQEIPRLQTIPLVSYTHLYLFLKVKYILKMYAFMTLKLARIPHIVYIHTYIHTLFLHRFVDYVREITRPKSTIVWAPQQVAYLHDIRNYICYLYVCMLSFAFSISRCRSSTWLVGMQNTTKILTLQWLLPCVWSYSQIGCVHSYLQ